MYANARSGSPDRFSVPVSRHSELSEVHDFFYSGITHGSFRPCAAHTPTVHSHAASPPPKRLDCQWAGVQRRQHCRANDPWRRVERLIYPQCG